MESASSLHANVRWSPARDTLFTAEYVQAASTLAGGEKGRLDRVVFSAQYYF